MINKIEINVARGGRGGEDGRRNLINLHFEKKNVKERSAGGGIESSSREFHSY